MTQAAAVIACGIALIEILEELNLSMNSPSEEKLNCK
jgi:hypothetical protein